jgi:acyl carrier protein
MPDETEQLKNAFSNVLGVDPTANFEELSYGNTAGWDSVAHMSLVAEIEKTFDVMLSTEDVIGLSSFPEARKILTGYGIQFPAAG